MHLFIDTHLNDIVYILYKDDEIIDQMIIKGKEHSKILMPKLKEILKDQVPESILVVNGPGSFTSVRLGVTIAKTLAYVLDIPIRVISFLECLAVSNDSEYNLVGFCDNNGYYVGNFNKNMEKIEDYKYLSQTEFKSYMKEHKVLTDIELDYTKIIKYGLKKELINPHKVNPIYVKKLDVEK